MQHLKYVLSLALILSLLLSPLSLYGKVKKRSTLMEKRAKQLSSIVRKYNAHSSSAQKLLQLFSAKDQAFLKKKFHEAKIKKFPQYQYKNGLYTLPLKPNALTFTVKNIIKKEMYIGPKVLSFKNYKGVEDFYERALKALAPVQTSFDFNRLLPFAPADAGLVMTLALGAVIVTALGSGIAQAFSFFGPPSLEEVDGIIERLKKLERVRDICQSTKVSDSNLRAFLANMAKVSDENKLAHFIVKMRDKEELLDEVSLGEASHCQKLAEKLYAGINAETESALNRGFAGSAFNRAEKLEKALGIPTMDEEKKDQKYLTLEKINCEKKGSQGATESCIKQYCDALVLGAYTHCLKDDKHNIGRKINTSNRTIIEERNFDDPWSKTPASSVRDL